MPVCTKCSKDKNINAFNIRKNRPLGRSSWCKDCIAIINIKYRVNPIVQQISRRSNPQRFRNYELKKLYGISRNDWEQLFISQGNCCAICKINYPTTKKGWNTDHNHETGKVRGILCGKCNSILGYSNENVTILLNAIKYINLWK